MTNSSWGTKRLCPSCSAHFYDLNKSPATCPKCQHTFEPQALVRPKRKPAKRAEQKENTVTATILSKKGDSRKKDKKANEDVDGAGDDIVEMEDDLENLQGLSELNEREEIGSEDEADEEKIIEEMDTGGKALVENVEDEEARVLVEEIEDEEQQAALKKKSKSPKAK